MLNNKYQAINSYFKEGKIEKWPSKKHKAKQLLILQYLAEQVPPNVMYSEKEISTLLNQHHHFGDAALLRREMIGYKLLQRKDDCSAYWRTTAA